MRIIHPLGCSPLSSPAISRALHLSSQLSARSTRLAWPRVPSPVTQLTSRVLPTGRPCFRTGGHLTLRQMPCAGATIAHSQIRDEAHTESGSLGFPDEGGAGIPTGRSDLEATPLVSAACRPHAEAQRVPASSRLQAPGTWRELCAAGPILLQGRGMAGAGSRQSQVKLDRSLGTHPPVLGHCLKLTGT